MLTHRQAEAHRFIFEFNRFNGQMPRYEDICEGLGMTKGSRGAVSLLLDQLEARGVIKRIPHMTRSITILKKPVMQNTAYFKAVYDQTEEFQELIPMEVA